MGGINVYQYAPNPVEWVDPWGLAKMGWYQYLKKAKDGLQAHHLNQNAAFKQWIPQKRGASIKLKGNAFFDRGLDHYVVHQELEKFWNQYRKGGVKYGENPTVADYNDAMKSALCKTSLSTKEVDKAVDSAMRNQRQFGVNPEMVFGRIPRRIYQR
ncbi:type IV secretion protein Rhs [Pelistega indica]|uniref:Type IV secretion protein Rhs n=1 Tax=Pelistega indica TaxID=1414851 RepID=V8G9U5_9BURK|nr:type IV secretion protein Rhs [Pelistega indica]